MADHIRMLGTYRVTRVMDDEEDGGRTIVRRARLDCHLTGDEMDAGGPRITESLQIEAEDPVDRHLLDLGREYHIMLTSADD